MKKRLLAQSLPVLLLQLLWGLISDCLDTLLVWGHLKYWPAVGRAKWRRKRKRDFPAMAWQRLIAQGAPPPAPCTHGSTTPATGHPGLPRICGQCGTVLSDGSPDPGP